MKEVGKNYWILFNGKAANVTLIGIQSTTSLINKKIETVNKYAVGNYVFDFKYDDETLFNSKEDLIKSLDYA